MKKQKQKIDRSKCPCVACTAGEPTPEQIEEEKKRRQRILELKQKRDEERQAKSGQ